MKNGFIGTQRDIIIVCTHSAGCPPGTFEALSIANTTLLRTTATPSFIGLFNVAPTHIHTIDWSAHTHDVPNHTFSGNTNNGATENRQSGIYGAGGAHLHTYSIAMAGAYTTSSALLSGATPPTDTGGAVQVAPYIDTLYCRVVC